MTAPVGDYSFKPTQDRAVWPLVAMTASSQMAQGVTHLCQLGDALLQLSDMTLGIMVL